MNWIVSLGILSALALGWAAGVWQCSRRGDCPKYAERRLQRWKRDVEQDVERRARGQHPSEES